MKHPEKVFDMPFISDNQATKVLQPVKEPLDFPTPSVFFQPTSILSRILSGSTMWGDDFNERHPMGLADRCALGRPSRPIPVADRRLFQARPWPSRRFIGSGISGSRVFHCLSVKSRACHMRVLMTCSARRWSVLRITSGLATNRLEGEELALSLMSCSAEK